MGDSLRRVRRIAMLIAWLILCLIPHLACRLFRIPSLWPKRFLALAARAVGARAAITGKPLTGDVFFIANHVSWVDILVLAGRTGTTFVAHDGIAGWPVVGWLAAQNNTIFVNRNRRGEINGQLDLLRTAMAGHQPVTLFPEGTTGDGVSLLPFKPSLFAVMIPPPRAVMIQPVHIDYGPATPNIAWHGNEPAGANAKRLLARRGILPVTLRFLDPFDPAAFPDRKAIAVESQKRIAASIATHLPPSAAPIGSV